MEIKSKRKVAVFASGWGSQILVQFLEGLKDFFEDKATEIYLFDCYPTYDSTDAERKAEFNILYLPNLSDFSAAIIIASGLESQNEIVKLCERCRTSGIPTVSLGYSYDGLYYVTADSSSAMKTLTAHLIEKHNIHRVIFLAGSKGNADSDARMNAVKETMEAHGLSLDEEDIFYTFWENMRTIDFVDEYCKSGKKLPDAFICANDGLAMNVCLALKDNNYKVPEDVIVTGVDALFDAQIFDPSIASISQNYTNLGFQCGKLLYDVLNSIPREKTLIGNCEFIPSESCGCGDSQKIDLMRRKLGFDYYANKNTDTLLDRKLSKMERRILTGVQYDDIRTNLIPSFLNDYKFEKDSFHIVLEPGFEMSIYNSNVQLNREGYSERMQVVFSMENRKLSSIHSFETRKLIPDHKLDDKTHIYIFVPIHESDRLFGYFIMGDCLQNLNNHVASKYQSRFNTAFERYRQKLNLDEVNRKLTEITRIDALTHVKNRMAYESKEMELLAQIKTGKKPEFAIAMFDINNLKTINDNLGHEKGDRYIQNSCRLICNTFKHSSVFRIGGDEFLAILMNSDYENRKDLEASIFENIKLLGSLNIPPEEKVSVACGIADYSPETDDDVASVFKRADSLMYTNKKLIKKGLIR